MTDLVGVFVDGEYVLVNGAARLTRASSDQTMPSKFLVTSFSSSIRILAKRLTNRDVNYRVYWYEQTNPDQEAELNRRLKTAQNSIVLRDIVPSFDSEQDAERSTEDDSIDHAEPGISNPAVKILIKENMMQDINTLVENRAISDVILVTQDVEIFQQVRPIQDRGIRVHVLVMEQSSPEQTVEIRANFDSFHTWELKDLRRVFTAEPLVAETSDVRNIDLDHYGSIIEETAASFDDSKDEEQEERLTTPAFQLPHTAIEDDQFSHVDVRPFVKAYVEKMDDRHLRSCMRYWQLGRRDVPTLHDKNVLAACREALGRILHPNERQDMRTAFQSYVSELAEEHGLSVNLPDHDESFERESSRNQIYGLPSASEVHEPYRESPRLEAPYSMARSGSFDADEEAVSDEAKDQISDFVYVYVAELNDDELLQCQNFWHAGNFGVPSNFDKGVMAICRQELGRHLRDVEKFFMRSEFKRVAEEVSQVKGLIGYGESQRREDLRPLDPSTEL